MYNNGRIEGTERDYLENVDDTSASEMPSTLESSQVSGTLSLDCRHQLVAKILKSLKTYLDSVESSKDDVIAYNKITVGVMIKHLSKEEAASYSVPTILAYLQSKLDDIKVHYNVKGPLTKKFAEPDEEVNKLYSKVQTLIFECYAIYCRSLEAMAHQHKLAQEALEQAVDPEVIGKLNKEMSVLEESKDKYKRKYLAGKEGANRLNEENKKLLEKNKQLKAQCDQLEQRSGSSSKQIAEAEAEARKWRQKALKRKEKRKVDVAELKAELKQARERTYSAYEQNNMQLVSVQSESNKQLVALQQQQQDAMQQICYMFEFLIKTKGGTQDLVEEQVTEQERVCELLGVYDDIQDLDLVAKMLDAKLMGRPRAQFLRKLINQYSNQAADKKVVALLTLASDGTPAVELVKQMKFGIALEGNVEDSNVLARDQEGVAKIFKYLAMMALQCALKNNRVSLEQGGLVFEDTVSFDQIPALRLSALFLQLSQDVLTNGLDAVKALRQELTSQAGSAFQEIDGSSKSFN